MKPKQVDILIAGQGLAGSILAWRLRQAGISYHIVDDEDPSGASRVAAGLLNPVTGLRLVKAWNIDSFYPQAMRLYQELEGFFSRRFFYPVPLIQIFKSARQKNQWDRRHDSPGMGQWYGVYLPPGSSPYRLHDPYGSYEQPRAGYTDIPDLLAAFRGLFEAENSLSVQALEYTGLHKVAQGLQWRHVLARRVVFCEGSKMASNPWFAGAGLRPVKGEILTVSAHTPLGTHIINKGHWLLPLRDGRYRAGATYNHDLDTHVTETGRQQLLQAVPGMLREPGELHVESHQAGIRPASADRRPLMGCHPGEPNLMVFNGFGSKGTLEIPACSSLMAAYIQGRDVIPPEMDVARFNPWPAAAQRLPCV